MIRHDRGFFYIQRRKSSLVNPKIHRKLKNDLRITRRNNAIYRTLVSVKVKDKEIFVRILITSVTTHKNMKYSKISLKELKSTNTTQTQIISELRSENRKLKNGESDLGIKSSKLKMENSELKTRNSDLESKISNLENNKNKGVCW